MGQLLGRLKDLSGDIFWANLLTADGTLARGTVGIIDRTCPGNISGCVAGSDLTE